MKLTLFILFLTFISAKQINKKISLTTLAPQPHILYLTKFGFNIGDGDVKINYFKNDQNGTSDPSYNTLKLGLLLDEQYDEFMKKQGSCQEKQSLFKYNYSLTFVDSVRGNIKFKVIQEVRQHLWYFYLYDCQYQPTQSALKMQLILLNNDSHVGSNQQLIPIYAILIVVWLMAIIYLRKVLVIFKWPHVLLNANFVLIGIHYALTMIELGLFAYFGVQMRYFHSLCIILKYIVEGLIVTIIVSIGWGWTLIHMQHDEIYMIMGVIVTFLNIASMILHHSLQQDATLHHNYDTTYGKMLIFLRIVIWMIFSVGVFRTLTQSVGKIKLFMKRLMLFGSGYLLSWPLTVLICELLLPNYLHRQLIALIEQFFHLLGTCAICYLNGGDGSTYKKLKIDDDIFPDKK